MWWFLIAVMSFFLVVFLVSGVAARSRGGARQVGPQQGPYVTRSGGWTGTGGGFDGTGEAGAGGSAGGAAGEAARGAGDGGGW